MGGKCGREQDTVIWRGQGWVGTMTEIYEKAAGSGQDQPRSEAGPQTENDPLTDSAATGGAGSSGGRGQAAARLSPHSIFSAAAARGAHSGGQTTDLTQRGTSAYTQLSVSPA